MESILTHYTPVHWLVLKTWDLLWLFVYLTMIFIVLHTDKHSLKNIFLFDVKYQFSVSLSCRSLWWQRSLLTAEDWCFLKRLLWFHICVYMMENEYYVCGNYVWGNYLNLCNNICSDRVRGKDSHSPFSPKSLRIFLFPFDLYQIQGLRT